MLTWTIAVSNIYQSKNHPEISQYRECIDAVPRVAHFLKIPKDNKVGFTKLPKGSNIELSHAGN